MTIKPVATRLALALWIVAIAMTLVVPGCADPPEPEPLPIGSSEQSEEELRAAYWRIVLDRQPDLPELLRVVPGSRAQADSDEADDDDPPSGGPSGPQVGPPATGPARILVTDLDEESLRALAAYLERIRDGSPTRPLVRAPETPRPRAFRLEVVDSGTGATRTIEADALEIAFHSTSDAQLDEKIRLHLLGSNSARGPPSDLIVIGSKATVHVRSPIHRDQAIAIQLLEGPRGSVGTATLHAFPNASRRTVPLETLVKEGLGARPPPVRVLLAGGLDEMNFHRVGREARRVTSIDVHIRNNIEDAEFVGKLDAVIKRGENEKIAQRVRDATAAAEAREAARRKAAKQAAAAEKARIEQAWRNKSLHGHVERNGRSVPVYDLGPEFSPKRYVIGETRYELLSNGVL